MLVSRLSSPRPRILAVGTSNPPACYSQEEVATLLAVPEGIGRRFFRTSGIDTRYLCMTATAECTLPEDDQANLLKRHREGALELGDVAIARCLTPPGIDRSEIDFLCCVSSTGFMLPGISAMYLRHLGFRHDCQRIDIVGMGCNAALNGLNATAGWSVANPGRHALLVCCEVNSAIHVRDDRLVTSLVNSLFGDGCGAVVLRSGIEGDEGPEVLGFSSHVVPEAWRAISYHWSAQHNKFELYLDKDIPRLLGEHSPRPIGALLAEFQLDASSIAHWLVHAGGKKVIRAVAEANGLAEFHMRHASEVLKNTGNLGSGTILFSYEELLKEGIVQRGDHAVVITMGPGATIETALLKW